MGNFNLTPQLSTSSLLVNLYSLKLSSFSQNCFWNGGLFVFSLAQIPNRKFSADSNIVALAKTLKRFCSERSIDMFLQLTLLAGTSEQNIYSPVWMWPNQYHIIFFCVGRRLFPAAVAANVVTQSNVMEQRFSTSQFPVFPFKPRLF